MAGKLPPLPALQAFEAAARYENFAAAAEELNLSQSAVSHRVRNLEQYLGFALFERLPRGLRLTEAAKAYLPSVRKAFEDILSATSGVFGQRGKASLNIRAPISYTTLWLTQIIDKFKAEHPQIEIHLTSSIWAERTATGESDIEIRIGDGNWTGYEAEFLFQDALVPVCSPATANLISAPTSIDNLQHCALIHVMGGEDTWEKFFAQSNTNRIANHSDIRVDASIIAAEQAVISDRIALIHKTFAEHYINVGRLVFASEEILVPQEAVYLLRPVSNEPRKLEALLFENWIKENASN